MKYWKFDVIETILIIAVASWGISNVIGVYRGTREPDGCGCFHDKASKS